MDPITGVILAIFLVIGAAGVIGSAATVDEARKRKPGQGAVDLEHQEGLNLYARAMGSSDPYEIEDIADQLYRGGMTTHAAQARAVLNHFYAALSSTTDEARVHYWSIVGAGFVNLANRVATQRPSVLQ